MKQKSTAYLLWVIGGFGLLGLHHFYMGKIGKGVLWLFTGNISERPNTTLLRQGFLLAPARGVCNPVLVRK
jgi:hypothetical protein